MPRDDEQERATTHRFSDPRSIRALAHPARVAIIDALATGDELTATQCAELTGLSPSATAYHLKLLERYGYAEPAAPTADGRERPWRASDRRVTIDIDVSTPAGASAAAAVGAAYFDATRAVALEYTENAASEPAEWQDAAINTTDVWLTAAEFHRVAEEISAVVQPYNQLARTEGRRRVRVMSVVVPHRRHQESRPTEETPKGKAT